MAYLYNVTWGKKRLQQQGSHHEEKCCCNTALCTQASSLLFRLQDLAVNHILTALAAQTLITHMKVTETLTFESNLNLTLKICSSLHQMRPQVMNQRCHQPCFWCSDFCSIKETKITPRAPLLSLSSSRLLFPNSNPIQGKKAKNFDPFPTKLKNSTVHYDIWLLHVYMTLLKSERRFKERNYGHKLIHKTFITADMSPPQNCEGSTKYIRSMDFYIFWLSLTNLKLC